VPLVERIVAELDVVVSVDTYKPAVAEAAIAAGATVVNDVSGLRDPALAAVCARGGAALVLVHTRAAPKVKLLDPGPDLGKTPAQTVEVLRALSSFAALGRPLLLAVSRKDFVGVITGRRPADRLSGTLAAVAHGLDAGAHILRVHDVAAVADFLAVRTVLRGEAALPPGVRLAEDLRRERAR